MKFAASLSLNARTIQLKYFYQHLVRYYGHYSIVSRGRRKKAQTDKQTPYILEPELNPKEYQQNWAQLIQKIYEGV